MENLKLFPALFVFHIIIAANVPFIQAAAPGNSNLFREYIGAQGVDVKFSDVHINPKVQFHFILSFAIDYTTDGSSISPTHGKFKPFWDLTNLGSSGVESIKKAHGNVNVSLSIGGDTLESNPVYFSPKEAKSWVDNAVSSLREIIEVKYEKHLDGIDINYEHFDEEKASPEVFAECIGQLITTLKDKKVISFASIAPFKDPTVQKYYQALWRSYGHVIDYVNFQFYAHSRIKTVDKFMEFFNEQSANYNEGKVLVSFTTGEVKEGQGGLLPGDEFFTACARLKAENKLHGIFVWSADSSKLRDLKNEYEKESQEMLLE